MWIFADLGFCGFLTVMSPKISLSFVAFPLWFGGLGAIAVPSRCRLGGVWAAPIELASRIAGGEAGAALYEWREALAVYFGH
ncbi:hypothetical protein [Prauserella cavernicola]|uniref:Uncharacterized protein n=1 Tax=Prauserella cavernicola TaxID=2800127 RepID=A0A934V6A4_9PSEU|nr:hypothetical protein [Prauserella cavernicola]MBK1785995.1 hypothetical protein [Prauserella cavernicola]